MTNYSILTAIINPIKLDESILDQKLLYSSNVVLALRHTRNDRGKEVDPEQGGLTK